MGEYDFSQVLFISEMLVKKKAEEAKEKYKLVAFNAYLNGAAPKKTFTEYLSAIGLGEQVDKEKLKMEIAHAKDVTAKILAMRNRN